MYGIGLILVAMAGGLEWLIITPKTYIVSLSLRNIPEISSYFLQGLLFHYIGENLDQSSS
jgi:hypothetical protein